MNLQIIRYIFWCVYTQNIRNYHKIQLTCTILGIAQWLVFHFQRNIFKIKMDNIEPKLKYNFRSKKN